MRKKYILSLIVIAFMFFICLGVGTGYGLWIATKNDTNYNTTTLNCFKAYFSNGEVIEMSNIKSIINEEGEETTPYNITVTNICDTTKELQLRLNTLPESNIDTNALTIVAAGNIEQKLIPYNELSDVKKTDKSLKSSKLIGLVSVEPNETVRTNIKLWFDERKAPTIPVDNLFKATFEIIDTESTIKPTFNQVLLSNNQLNNELPNYFTLSTTYEGLYNLNNTYYYRGEVTNNYLLFANQLWRIMSFNDNHIQLILNANALSTPFNYQGEYPDYLGLTYIYNNDIVSSNIYSQLQNWYYNNIEIPGYDKYIIDTTICNDTNYYEENGFSTFASFNRIISNEPSLSCNPTTSDFGGIYNSKVSLITADEVIIAGGLYNTPNQNYYLNNGESFFTVTPATSTYGSSKIFIINNEGSITEDVVNASYGLRPIINISSSYNVLGNGTIEEPYILDED